MQAFSVQMHGGKSAIVITHYTEAELHDMLKRQLWQVVSISPLVSRNPRAPVLIQESGGCNSAQQQAISVSVSQI